MAALVDITGGPVPEPDFIPWRGEDITLAGNGSALGGIAANGGTGG